MRRRCWAVGAVPAAARRVAVASRFTGGREWRLHDGRRTGVMIGLLAVPRRFCSGRTPGRGTTSTSASDSSEPPGERAPLAAIDTPKPPRPAFYVPPQERDPGDESLAFLKPGSPLQHLPRGGVDAVLPEGLELAPTLPERQRAAPAYMDADSARVGSTSVHAGRSLLRGGAGIDSGVYYYSAPQTLPGADGAASVGGGPVDASHRSRLHALRADQRAGGSGSGEGFEGRVSTTKERSLFVASHEFVSADKTVEELEDEQQRTAPRPPARQLEADIKKLEYYQGTPQYDQLLADFRVKYGADGGDGGGDGSAAERASGPAYTAAEVARGLDGQPIDYLHGSTRLQTQLLTGPRAYDPITIMQQHGVLRFQGYAFPPTAELGKLKGDGDELKALHDVHKTHPLVAQVRRTFNALVGRRDARDDYVVAGDRPKEDTHLLYRTMGLDAVQRRQMRYMLTDFDHADRNTAFHVMLSYPYTDWLHVFYMVLVGWCLYQLQVRCGAYEFYDEYLGLDLRQVPRLQRPVLAGITVIVMTFFFFQPLLVASIATTRAYRILMRRPIGPP